MGTPVCRGAGRTRGHRGEQPAPGLRQQDFHVTMVSSQSLSDSPVRGIKADKWEQSKLPRSPHSPVRTSWGTAMAAWLSPCFQHCPTPTDNTACTGCDAQASFCTLNTFSLLIKPNPENVDCKLFNACQGTKKTSTVTFSLGPSPSLS